MDKLEKWTRVRIRFVGFLFVLAFVLVVARAFQLQVLGQETWQRRAEQIGRASCRERVSY